jgi:thiol-disulfide isomerase/thioredoxin
MKAAAKAVERSRRRRRTIAVAAASALAVALVGAVAARSAQDPATAAAAQVTGTGAQIGASAPQVTARALDGRQVELPADKPSAVFFFASWCGTCIPEAAALGKLHREHGDDVNIVAVSIDPGDTPETIEQFMQAAGSPDYPVLHDRNDSIRAAYEVTSLDVTVITDADGKVAYRDAVPSTLDQLQDGLRRAGAQV